MLERGFLPTFEKFGKRLQILLDPDGAYLCQAPEENDGLLLTARISGVGAGGHAGCAAFVRVLWGHDAAARGTTGPAALP